MSSTFARPTITILFHTIQFGECKPIWFCINIRDTSVKNYSKCLNGSKCKQTHLGETLLSKYLVTHTRCYDWQYYMHDLKVLYDFPKNLPVKCNIFKYISFMIQLWNT